MESPSFRQLIKILEAQEEYYQVNLPAKRNEFEPVFSKETIDLHYGTLYKAYIDAAKAGTASDFQLAGAFLHTILFEQIQIPKASNLPLGAIKFLIDDKFDNFDNFKDEFESAALDIHGSGWCYLDTRGNIKTIANHKIVSDIAILVDTWEHSYQLDYLADKKKYLKENWKTIDWDIINARLNNRQL